MRAVTVLLKDLRQIVRDRRALVFLLLMPVAFTVFFGLAFSGVGGDDARLSVGVIDLDESALSTRLVAWLGESRAVRPEAVPASQRSFGDDLVRRGERAAVVRIPSGWGAALVAGDPVPVDVVADPGSAAGLAAVRAVDGVVARFTAAQRAAGIAVELVPSTSPTAALETALAAWQDPPLRLEARSAVASSAPEAASATAVFGSNPYSQASPGMIVQFAVYGLLLSAMVLVVERTSGTMARLLTTPTRRAALLAGHAGAMFVLVLAQILVLEAFGQFVVGVDYLARPAATLALTVALALWSASLGMLLGAFARSEEQVVAFALVAMFLFSGLGGAWFPLEITGATFAAVGHITPTAWAMDAYRAILVRGGGFAEVLPSLGVLVGAAALFFVVAVARLRRVAG